MHLDTAITIYTLLEPHVQLDVQVFHRIKISAEKRKKRAEASLQNLRRMHGAQQLFNGRGSRLKVVAWDWELTVY